MWFSVRKSFDLTTPTNLMPIGLGLTLFGSVLQEIYYFKPQVVLVSVIFLAVISYVLGMLMEKLIPTKGFIGKWLNPHKFNKKEHCAIVIMGSAVQPHKRHWALKCWQCSDFGTTPRPMLVRLSSY